MRHTTRNRPELGIVFFPTEPKSRYLDHFTARFFSFTSLGFFGGREGGECLISQKEMLLSGLGKIRASEIVKVSLRYQPDRNQIVKST